MAGTPAPCCSSNLACRSSVLRLLVEGHSAPVEHAVTPDFGAHIQQTTKLDPQTDLAEAVARAKSKGNEMFNYLIRSITVASVAATLLFAANPLAAAEMHSIAVQSSDLNLARDADRAIFQQRIAHAVDRICGSAHARTTADAQAYATCSKAARATAATQYDAVIAKAQMGMKVAGDRKNGTSAE